MRIFRHQLSTLNSQPEPQFSTRLSSAHMPTPFRDLPSFGSNVPQRQTQSSASSIFQINRVLVPSPNPRREFSQHAAAPLPPSQSSLRNCNSNSSIDSRALEQVRRHRIRLHILRKRQILRRWCKISRRWM